MIDVTDPPRAGLSPRGRGNLAQQSESVAQEGSIPAWAGEPLEEAGYSLEQRVYPRVGGEPS